MSFGLDEAGRRAGTAARRIGIGKPAGWVRGWRSGGDCRRYRVMPAIIWGSHTCIGLRRRRERARRGACSVKFSEASGGRGPSTKQRGVPLAAEPGAWYGVYGGSLSAVRPTQGVWMDFRGESGLLSRDEARTVDT